MALGALTRTSDADRPRGKSQTAERRVLKALGALGQASEAGGTDREIKALESRVLDALDALGGAVRPVKPRSLSNARKGQAAA